jgi:predicted ATPase/DNA-binding CsgD family transcriptional regulator
LAIQDNIVALRSRQTRPTGPLPINNLAAPLTSLIGREREVMAVSNLLQRPEVRFVTLTGPGGVGKTRLALAVASELREDFSHGVCFVSLAPVSDPNLVIAVIAQTLGLWEAGDRSLLEQLQAYLRDQHLLLLLDNFEQVVVAAPQLANLLASCPHLHLLVTSRAALRIQGEFEFTVSPLAVPDPKRLPTNEDLAQVATVQLFLERARAIQPDFQLTTANARTIAAICARLEGLPLAIELAAARIKLFPPQALLKRLKDRLQVLTGGAQDLPTRQQTLRNTLQWSYDLLSREEQRLFRQLSIFVGGCSLQAAEAVGQVISHADNNQAMEVLEGVVSLLDKSLLQQTELETEEPRLMMLETIREYGLTCLQACGELEATRRAHAAYYLRLAEEAAVYHFSAEAGIWFELLEREQENLRAALQWALERQDEEAESGIEIAVRLGWALWRFWSVRGHLSGGRIVLERVLVASERSRAPVRAKALSATALLASYQGDYVRAEQLCGEALTLFQQLADQQGVIHVLAALIGVALHRRDSVRIHALAEESLALLRRDRDAWWTAYFLVVLARGASFQGEYARAYQLFEESLALLRPLGYPGDVAWPLLYMAHDLIIQGEHARARPLLEEGLALCRAADSKGGLAYALSLLAQMALEQGDVDSASAHVTESLRLNQEVGYRQSISRSLFFLANVVVLQGDYVRARALYEESLAIATTLEHQGLIASCLEGLAVVVTAQGQLAWAARLWGAAETARQGRGTSLPQVMHASDEQARNKARTSLGEKGFAEAWAQGRAMSPQEALAAREPVPMSKQAVAEPTITSAKTRFPNQLTRREVEVLRLVAEGLTDAQVGHKLVISPGTVSWYMRSICSKLGVSSRTAATRSAIEQHLI